jgi:hypothetical protein
MDLTDAQITWLQRNRSMSGNSSAPQAGSSSSADAASGQNSGPAATPGKQFQATNDATIKQLRTAAGRIVDAGPALDARNRLSAALTKLDAAITADDVAGAQAALADAQKEAVTVNAAPDPAMEPVKPGAHPDEVLDDRTDDEKKAGTPEFAVTDIHQEQVGDCYLLSSVGEIAKIRPDILQKMIKDNGNGTYTVTFHEQKSGLSYVWGKVTGDTFKEVQVTVDGNFAPNVANSGPADDVVAGKKEIWVQVVEKAYAKYHGGYDKIQGGDPANALQELTGKEATSVGTGSVSLKDLQDDVAAKKPIVMSTPDRDEGKKGKMPFKMHSNHAYMVDHIEAGPDGKARVFLRNPWGHDDPDPIPFDQLGTVIGTVSVGGSL